MFGAAVVGLNQNASASLTINSDITETVKQVAIAETLENNINVQPVVLSTEQKVKEYFEDIPVMIDVVRCESQFRQFNSNGQPLRGLVNSDDVGVTQINEFYHGATAKKLGHDLTTLEGNMAYARNLYEREGTAPWVHSSSCWGKSREVAIQ